MGRWVPAGWRLEWAANVFRVVFYALLLAVVIRTLIFQPFNIPSGSMENTLLVGDYFFVTKFSYGYSKHSLPWSPALFSGRIWSGQPERGDVVVFKLPARPGEDYIKRVVGLPGDRIQMIDGVLHINGMPCQMRRVDDYVRVSAFGGKERIPRFLETLPNGVSYHVLDQSLDYPGWDDTQEFVVPPGHYFMMGDNRDQSNDSRIPNSGVGFVPEENLVGRADLILFSTDGSAKNWEFWKWPWAIRYGRIFQSIH